MATFLRPKSEIPIETQRLKRFRGWKFRFKCAASISRIVRSRSEQAGIELPSTVDAHLLRHSLATQLVRRRRPINEVADLLGHRSIDTTAIYVKVALPQLADVALPFPGDAS